MKMRRLFFLAGWTAISWIVRIGELVLLPLVVLLDEIGMALIAVQPYTVQPYKYDSVTACHQPNAQSLFVLLNDERLPMPLDWKSSR